MGDFNNLKKWLGVKDSVYINMDVPQRGIYTKKPIKEGDIILKIPDKKIIDDIKVKQYISKLKNGNEVIQLNNLGDTNGLFALYLSLQPKKSKWNPYINILPQDLSNYPLMYNKNDIKCLKGTHYVEKHDNHQNINDYRKYNKSKFDVIYNLIKDDEKINKLDKKTLKQNFLKYLTLANSRLFNYYRYNDSVNGLVPYADLFNHSNTENATWYFDDNLKSFIVKATKNIDANSEIFDSYGPKNDDQLLFTYGFGIKDNENSTIPLKINVKKMNNTIELPAKFDKYSIDSNINTLSVTNNVPSQKIKKIIKDKLTKKIETINNTLKKNNNYLLQNYASILKQYASSLVSSRDEK